MDRPEHPFIAVYRYVPVIGGHTLVLVNDDYQWTRSKCAALSEPSCLRSLPRASRKTIQLSGDNNIGAHHVVVLVLEHVTVENKFSGEAFKTRHDCQHLTR